MDQDLDLRNQLLAEIIDKMQDRLAEKEYPSEKPKEEEILAAVTEEPKAEETPETDEELTDEEIAALTPAEDSPVAQ